jgi:hypothetical protein
MLSHLATSQHTIHISTKRTPRLDKAHPHRRLPVGEACPEQHSARDGAVSVHVLDEFEFLSLVVTLLRRRPLAVADVVSLLVLVNRLQIVLVVLVADMERTGAPTSTAILELEAVLQR